MKDAIHVEDLTKYYEKFLAVDHINFTVKQGEIFGFLGPNGAGKTTTQRMLTTLLTPTGGRILINGHDLSRDSYPAKQQVGLVPEESNVYTELTAWDNLMFTASLYRVPRGERAKRAQELLETFGLWEKRAKKAENFSKGMRRRLSIAMAIIHKPSLLFLDEPTPGLDAQSIRAIWGLIRQMNAEGTTVFITTHQIEEANQLCGRVAIISHGKIAAIDTPERLKADFRRTQSVEVAFEPLESPVVSETSRVSSEGLESLPGVTTQVKVGDRMRLYTEDPSALLPHIIQHAGTHALRIVSLNTLGPSLEDVFLEITGGQLGAVSKEEEKPGKRGMGGRK
jgi:ABC-2 type transport system ATP-binding protein